MLELNKEAIQKRNNVQFIGKGEKTILFAHGFGCDQQVWHKVTPAFEEAYQIILFDYVGSGRSDKSGYNIERYSEAAGYAQDILDIIEAFDLKDIIFVGHSISGMLGLLASIKNPTAFDKLCLVGPSPCYLNKAGYDGGFDQADIDELIDMMERNYKEWAKYLAPVAAGNPERPELAEEFAGYLMANDQRILREFCKMTFQIDCREALKSVLRPTLIMQAREDSIVPIKIGEYMHDHIENSTYVLMDAKGHNPHLSDVEETVQLIKEFVG